MVTFLCLVATEQECFRPRAIKELQNEQTVIFFVFFGEPITFGPFFGLLRCLFPVLTFPRAMQQI